MSRKGVQLMGAFSEKACLMRINHLHDVLQVTADRRAECLTTAAEVDKLEDLFGVRIMSA
jgi:hypothetical protein